MTRTFNLPAPPGFRGMHPDLPIRIYQRRLPHWRQDGATYSVTFRLADSIPYEKQQALKRWRKQWERENPEPRSDTQWHRFAKEITRRTDAWLDEGCGECVFRVPVLAENMEQALTKFQDRRYRTDCYVVMPNHVHAVVRPFAGNELEHLLQAMKAAVSRRVNEYFERRQTLWADESYDRIIRDEEHLWRVVQYIGRNPIKANLPQSQWCRWVHPEWVDAGWGFRDE